MLKYFYNNPNGVIEETDSINSSSWIHIVSPTQKEIEFIQKETNIPENFIRAALDQDETARYDVDGDSILYIVDTPEMDRETNTIETFPFALIQNKNKLLTVSMGRHKVLENFFNAKQKNLDITKITKTIYQIMLSNVSFFMSHLRLIDKMSDSIQENFSANSMHNGDILKLLDIQKTLVYFSASLTANNALVQKITGINAKRTNTTEDEMEILDDISIENRQALEMCQIYRDINKNSMDAYDALIANKQNNAMRLLTILNALIVIPTWIAGLMGMNVRLPMGNDFDAEPYAFWIYTAIGVVLSFLSILPFMLIKNKIKRTGTNHKR
ncbi:MAG: magnesium transporter CorA family protein [Christensenellaceae bacterium]|jgi:magnesium transporter|nr:magnesium transporter CorA family protein [Christensenellaceae bacterium]